MQKHLNLNFTDAWIGKYHFLKLLGRGAYASVWLADECSPNREIIRPVAIKVFVDDFSDRQSFQDTFDNFQLDLKFLAELAPDNPIIQYYNSEMADIFVGANGIPETVNSRMADKPPADDSLTALTAFLIVMEYADGGALGPSYRDEVITSTDKFYLDHFIDVCVGLRAAHSREIIHRDIKPRNLLWFKRTSRVKIGDFGIAKHLNEIRPLGIYMAGTPAYMSPESFNPTSPVRPERDIYALGCTFYELLTGEAAITLPPHLARTPELEQIEAYKKQHETAPRPDAVVKAVNSVPVDLSGLIKRMMHVDPSARPTLDEVIDGLNKAKRPPYVYPPLETGGEAAIPEKPVHRSAYNVNPKFRREQLKETAFFIFITMSVQTRYKYKTLFSFLNGFFGDTYSICELFGRYDFLVRIWSNRNHVSAFCKRVIDELLEDDRSALHVMACDEVHYLGASAHSLPNDHLPVKQILVKLNEAQSERAEGAKDAAARWLQKHHVYVRRIPHSIEGTRVHCFCLVSQASRFSQADKEARFAMIIRALENKFSHLKGLSLSIYKKAYSSLEGLESERSDYLISYVAPAFDEVASIPSVILDDLADQHLRVNTLLASKRYYIDSDAVYQH